MPIQSASLFHTTFIPVAQNMPDNETYAASSSCSCSPSVPVSRTSNNLKSTTGGGSSGRRSFRAYLDEAYIITYTDKWKFRSTYFLPRSAFCISCISARILRPAKGPYAKRTGLPIREEDNVLIDTGSTATRIWMLQIVHISSCA